ncbi:MAG: PA14 domain-containing protein, partial [Bdellovibrionota bacterium]
DKKSFSGGSKISPSQAANVEPAPLPAPNPDPIVDSPITDEKDTFKDCDNSNGIGVVGTVYRLEKSEGKFLDFSSRTPVSDICIKQFDINRRDFDEGFPGVSDLKQWFGIDFYGNLTVDIAGEYKFKIVSDDGSIFLIDGHEVINNNGTQSATAKEGSAVLTAGVHKINVKYFQGPPNEIALELFWTPPGGNEVYVPSKNLKHAN